MSKHTPAPWEFKLDDDGREATPITAGGALIASVYGAEDFPCLEVQEVPMVAESQAANARLIAAAPELLDALQALRVSACQLGDFMYGAVRECSQDMIRVIDAAIAKADGVDPENAPSSAPTSTPEATPKRKIHEH